jgi:hypothetical protein
VLLLLITVRPPPRSPVSCTLSLEGLFGTCLIVVLSRGLVVDDSEANPYHKQDFRLVNAKAMKDFNEYVASEPRVEVVVLPLFDGLGLIRLKD